MISLTYPRSAKISPDQTSPSAQVKAAFDLLVGSHPPSTEAPTPTTAMVCPKATRLQTRMRTGTGEAEAEAMAGRAAAGAVAPPWKAETQRAAEGAARVAESKNRRREEEEGTEAAPTAIDEELRRFRTAATASGREKETAAAAERILKRTLRRLGQGQSGNAGRRSLCKAGESDGDQTKERKQSERKLSSFLSPSFSVSLVDLLFSPKERHIEPLSSDTKGERKKKAKGAKEKKSSRNERK